MCAFCGQMEGSITGRSTPRRACDAPGTFCGLAGMEHSPVAPGNSPRVYLKGPLFVPFQTMLLLRQQKNGERVTRPRTSPCGLLAIFAPVAVAPACRSRQNPRSHITRAPEPRGPAKFRIALYARVSPPPGPGIFGNPPINPVGRWADPAARPRAEDRRSRARRPRETDTGSAPGAGAVPGASAGAVGSAIHTRAAGAARARSYAAPRAPAGAGAPARRDLIQHYTRRRESRQRQDPPQHARSRSRSNGPGAPAGDADRPPARSFPRQGRRPTQEPPSARRRARSRHTSPERSPPASSSASAAMRASIAELI